jgi:hypothetical protein
METPIIPEQESIDQSISAAFDSVDLINELKLLSSLTENQQERLDRNTQHLEIMLAKEWFFNALTEQQKILINYCLQ